MIIESAVCFAFHEFTCCACGEVKDCNKVDGGTGYGVRPGGFKLCYDCCADLERQSMVKTGHATLYLVTSKTGGARKVTDWPGKLAFPVREYSRGGHNLAGSRTDVWFTGPDGALWHGYNIGDMTQLCHCRRTKRRAA